MDDEKLIRDGLRILLSEMGYIKVVGEAASLLEAQELIRLHQPELVLLDIQLKNETGFDMLDSFPNPMFKLVFITAHNEYALKAFKYNAFDYLLKPIDPEELSQTIERLVKQKNDTKAQIQRLKENSDFQKITVKTSERIYVLDLEEIIRCESDQGYTYFHLKNNKRILSAKTLKEYNTLLPDDQFVRVHQSHLLNRNYVVAYDKKGFLILANNEKVPVSVRKRHLLSKLV